MKLGSAPFTSARDGFNDRLLFDGRCVTGEIAGRRLPSSSARHVGTQSTVQHVWTPSHHGTMVTVFAWCRVGAFLRETPPGRSTPNVTTWRVYRF